MYLYVWSIPKPGQPRISRTRLEELLTLLRNPLFTDSLSLLPKTPWEFYKVDDLFPGRSLEKLDVKSTRRVKIAKADRNRRSRFRTVSKPVSIPYRPLTDVILMWLHDPVISKHIRLGAPSQRSAQSPVLEFNQTPLFNTMHALQQGHIFRHAGKEWRTGDFVRYKDTIGFKFYQLGGVTYQKNSDLRKPPTIHLKVRPLGCKHRILSGSTRVETRPLTVLQKCTKIQVAPSSADRHLNSYIMEAQDLKDEDGKQVRWEPAAMNFTLPAVRSGDETFLQIQLYVDGFTNSISSNESQTGVYATLANFDREFRYRSESIVTLMIIPDGVPIHVALEPLRRDLQRMLPKQRLIDVLSPTGFREDPTAGGGFLTHVALSKTGLPYDYHITAECPILNFDSDELKVVTRGPANGSYRCCCSCWAVKEKKMLDTFCPPGFWRLDTRRDGADVMERKLMQQMELVFEQVADAARQVDPTQLPEWTDDEEERTEEEEKNEQQGVGTMLNQVLTRLGVRKTIPRPSLSSSTIGLWMNLRDPDHIWFNLEKALSIFTWKQMNGSQRRRWRSRICAMNPPPGFQLPDHLLDISKGVRTYGTNVTMSTFRNLHLVGTCTLKGLIPDRLYKHWCELWDVHNRVFSRPCPADIPDIQKACLKVMEIGISVCPLAWRKPNAHTFLCFVHWTLPTLVNVGFARTSRFEKHHQSAKKQNQKVSSSWKTKLIDCVRRQAVTSILNGTQWLAGEFREEREAGPAVRALVKKGDPLLCSLATPRCRDSDSWTMEFEGEELDFASFVKQRTAELFNSATNLVNYPWLGGDSRACWRW